MENASASCSLNTSAVTNSECVSFSHSLSIKLDEKNYLLWKPQILAAIRGHKLQRFLDPNVPMLTKFESQQDAQVGKVSKIYADWESQDQLILSWLLASMTESMLTRVVRCDSSRQVWSRMESFFNSQTRAKANQYKMQLRNTKKDSLSISEYLLKIKNAIDSLISIGCTITVNDHIDAILEGLPEEYLPFVTSVTSRLDPYSVEDIESLLLAHESHVHVLYSLSERR